MDDLNWVDVIIGIEEGVVPPVFRVVVVVAPIIGTKS